MLSSLTEARVPDPLHLEGWEEQDEPMATDWRHREQDYCCAVLRERFVGPDRYVTRDRWPLMDPANQADKLLPDLLVALGVPDRNREEYNPLIEGKPPDLLAELLSKDTRRIDMEDKRERYAKLGVREYFVFNPERRFRLPRINGWTLHSDGSASPSPARCCPCALSSARSTWRCSISHRVCRYHRSPGRTCACTRRRSRVGEPRRKSSVSGPY
jgi:Uma2 family endonuclease